MHWLKEKRESHSMTQKNVATQVGLSRAAYTNIETGAKKPSVKLAKRIAEVLGFDWTKFYE